MHAVLVATIAVAAWVCAPLKAQEDVAEPAVTVHSLTIDASDLAAGESQRLVQTFQGGKYVPGELTQRVRQALRDEGYYEAKCDLDGVKDSDDGQTADITLRVRAGAQYRLAGIRFTGATLFQAPQLRSLFAMEDGALLNATAIGQGLDRMRDLYAQSGYINFASVATPEVDESHRTIAFTFDVDEGKQFYFGRLLMDGAEPKAGAAQSLQDAWVSLHQKPYSPAALSEWLRAHAPYWPPEAGQPLDHVRLMQNPEAQQVDVVLEFP
ncbi:MAG TPA: POTRA domain-containing protein [Terracidiphilus sp.]|nr:POTRA domain-containing protein [Terracidiphilus sp.]